MLMLLLFQSYISLWIFFLAGCTASPVVVDDRDPGIIYVGSWVAGGEQGEFNVTTRGVAAGISSSASFTFTGTEVAVFGTVDTFGGWFGIQSPWSSYSVDEGPSTNFSPNLVLGKQFRVQYYRSPSLPEGQHTLKILVHGKFPLGSAFYLDYIEYTPPAEKAPGLTPPPSPAGSTTTTVVAGTVSTVSTPGTVPTSTTPITTFVNTTTTTSSSSLVSSQSQNITSGTISTTTTSSQLTSSSMDSPSSAPSIPSSPATSSSASTSNSKVPVGAIAGAVVAGVVLFVAIVNLLFFCWRRKLRKTQRSVTPYDRPFSGSTPTKTPEKGDRSHHWQLLGRPSNPWDTTLPISTMTPWPLEDTDARGRRLSDATLIVSNHATGFTDPRGAYRHSR